MPNALAVLLTCAAIAYAVIVSVRLMGSAWVLTPLFLFVCTSALFVNTGFLVFFLGSANEVWAGNAVLATSVGLIATATGGLVGHALIPVRRRWAAMPWKQTHAHPSFTAALRVGIVIQAVVAFYFYKIGTVPLFAGIKTLITSGFVPGLVNSARTGRDLYVNPDAAYIPLQGLLESIRYFGLPLVAIWFVHFYREKIRRRVSLGMVLVSVGLIVATGQRWPLMYLALAVATFLSWTNRGSTQFSYVLARVGAAALLAAVVLSALLGRTLETDLSLPEMVAFGMRDLAERILFGNVEVPFASYRLFSDPSAHLQGASWLQNLRAYLPGPEPSFPVTFYQMVSGDRVGFTAPPDFFTEAFINFGFVGVVGICFLWGGLLVAAQWAIARGRPSLLLKSAGSVAVTVAAFTAISGVMFGLGAAIVGVLVAAMLLISRLFASGRAYRRERQVTVSR